MTTLAGRKRRAGMLAVLVAVFATAVRPVAAGDGAPLRISGRYPHLAMFNHQGECGTGAVVPWAERLWVITYGPHLPNGSDDKLYEIDAELRRVTRPESVGGTPADRLIHRESQQLIIGPYFIDARRNVRVVPPARMPGRLTAAARHLTDPADKVYILDMEGMLYEVDVHSLAATKRFDRVAPGAHAKGAYTGQGRLVVANNGNAVVNRAKPAAADPGYDKDPEAAGVLAEWDGKTWRILERRQFTDVTGPGGIAGAPSAEAPLWALGWDKRSVLLELLDGGRWHTFRLPIADYSYVAKHGWHTEWPRIREVAPGKLLLNMHGGWFDFPRTFSAANTGGLRPLGSYLKITGDFCGWKDEVVFGCDDAAIADFRSGNNPLTGQSQSNLWFSPWAGLSHAGRPAGAGGPWLDDDVQAGEPSTPYLFAGYDQRVLHLSHDSDQPVTFKIEIDGDGHGKWATYRQVTVPAHGYAFHVFPADVAGEWVRLTADRACPKASARFLYGPGGGATTERGLFASLPDVVASAAGDNGAWSAGTLRLRGQDKGTLLFDARTVTADGKAGDAALLEVGPDMTFTANAKGAARKPDAAPQAQVEVDEASVVVLEGKKRFRLPRSDAAFDKPVPVFCRSIREVVTERSLLNAHGSLYMLPRPNCGGASRLKPVCTHDKRITDFCSWRGLLVLAGNRADAKPDGHYFAAGAGIGLWFGDIDDLWKLGKPRGRGGPWLRTAVEPGRASDPYLMEGYDHKTVEFSHDAPGAVRITLEVDVEAMADDSWRTFRTFDVPAGRTTKFEFPQGYSAHWVRARCDTACRATVTFTYD